MKCHILYTVSQEKLWGTHTPICLEDCKVVYHSWYWRKESGAVAVCTFSSWFPIFGCLISLGLTQTCSLSSLHTLSARWFVHICGIWTHSLCFGKWCMQPVKMPTCLSVHPAVCLSVTHCSLHMQWLRRLPICFSLWLCVRGCVYLYMTHVYLCLSIYLFFFLQRNTTPAFRRSCLSSLAQQLLGWCSSSRWLSSSSSVIGESVLTQSLLNCSLI